MEDVFTSTGHKVLSPVEEWISSQTPRLETERPQLGALGLVLNCIVLWNTVYADAAIDQLRAIGHPVHDEDVARLLDRGTLGKNNVKLSIVAKTYDPSNLDSTVTYKWIGDNLSAAVEGAIRIRTDYRL